ncbi:hypothetical protein ACU8KH_04474 [Lachancea thermotolerans]
MSSNRKFPLSMLQSRNKKEVFMSLVKRQRAFRKKSGKPVTKQLTALKKEENATMFYEVINPDDDFSVGWDVFEGNALRRNALLGNATVICATLGRELPRNFIFMLCYLSDFLDLCIQEVQ